MSQLTNLHRLASYADRPLTLVPFSDLINFIHRPTPQTLLHTTKFLSTELPTRLAHRYTHLTDSLPANLNLHPTAVKVKEWYAQSFAELVEFNDALEKHSADPARTEYIDGVASVGRGLFGGLVGGVGKWMRRRRSLKEVEGVMNRVGEFDVPPGLRVTMMLEKTPESLHLLAPRTYSTLHPTTPPHLTPYTPLYTSHFACLLTTIAHRHSPIIPLTASTISTLPYLQPSPSTTPPHPQTPTNSEIQHFLQTSHKSQSSLRLLISHYLSLHSPSPHTPSSFIGIIDTNISIPYILEDAIIDASNVVEETLGQTVNVSVIDRDGESGAKGFTHVPMWIRYAVFECVKNALRSVVEKGSGGVEVEWWGEGDSYKIRISDTGTGISPHTLPKIFDYAFTTVKHKPTSNNAPMAGFGYGLPLSRLYMRFFNGDLTVQSKEGEGTQVILTIKRTWEGVREVLI
ncbi:hypothetical protein HDV00_012246 [Rhizophlyctis rosea]|nr:hypothetical protein HDV00_012246 [Rhizophlyctis rosea]